MKTENIFIKGLNREITFYIGQNQSENFDVIDKGNADDLWFHANETSSCHVVAIIPNDIKKKDMKHIVKMGALLCKMNTSKLKSLNHVEITYTHLKHIEKTDVPGCVITKLSKIIQI